ncbi:hypothetical protein [Sphingomonas sp. MMS24-J13]|uniref:hypothetical protein n=1 Tax=Sphingomonas sp. MMS24-J13 TaxID=3238686 RepID=UPI0038517791
MFYDETKRRAIREADTKSGEPDAQSIIAGLEAAIRRRDTEIGTLVRLLEESRAATVDAAAPNVIDSTASQAVADQFNRTIRTMTDALARWIGRSFAQRVVRNALLRSGAFNPSWYLDHYPDVRKSGQDPLQHYLHHGIHERRAASPVFQFSPAN